MISLFRKYIVLRPVLKLAVVTGIVSCSCLLMGTASAGAQVATRTQLATQQDAGVVTLTAKVADVEGAPIREGAVSFETAKGSLGSVFVQDGVASLSVTHLPAWAQTVTAVYHGDTAFAASSAGATVTADTASGLPGFTVTASPGTLSLSPGDYSTVNLTVTSQNNFSEQVNLSCSGLPDASQCNFSPGVVTPPANGSVITPLQITTTAPSGINSKNNGLFGRSGTAYALVIPGVLALAGVGALRRKHFGALRVLGMVLLLAAGSLGLSACNARYSYEHYHPSPNVGTTAGNYTIVIAAYSTDGTSITDATPSGSGCTGATCIALTVK